MATKITRDILESYLHCKLKGHFKLTGQQGSKCDYETLLTRKGAESGSPLSTDSRSPTQAKRYPGTSP